MKALITVAALLVVLGLGFFLYSSPPTSLEMTEAEIAQIETEVNQVLDDLMTAWNAEDLEGSLAPFDSEELLVRWAADIDDGPQAFRARMVDIWERALEWEGDWDYRYVEVISPTSALFIGSYQAVVSFASGSTRSWHPEWTSLLERKDSGWRIILANHVFDEAVLVEEG
jgi:uncharacterized protein (TIGR02246 family)